jgi:ribosomal-protein-alanine N-acetyltransferase
VSLAAKKEFVSGSRVYLRPLEREDLNATYLGWLNDPQVTRYLETGVFPSTMQDLENFYSRVTSSSADVILAVIDRKTNKHIGNVKLGPINWVDRRALFGILIGDKKFWGKGFGEEATRLTVEYGFGRLNLNRIGLAVFEEHKGAVRCYEKVGFTVEGRFREEVFREGKYKDRLWMGLLRSNYDSSRSASRRKRQAES